MNTAAFRIYSLEQSTRENLFSEKHLTNIHENFLYIKFVLLCFVMNCYIKA
jgi:hypothetical protein